MSNLTTTTNLVDATGLNIFFDLLYTKYLSQIATCVQQEQGKELYPTADKTKLSGIESGAQVNVIESVTINNGSALSITNKNVNISIPTNNSQLSNGAGYAVAANLATVATSGSYSDLSNVPTNLNQFENGPGYLTQHQDISGKANSADLAAVATSGSYSDLSGVPTKLSQFTNDPGYLTSHQSLSAYATQTWVNNKFDDVLGINADGISALKTALSDDDKTTGILTAIAGKVDKESGKRLMTDSEGTKLSGIETGAQTHRAPTTAEVKSALGTGSGTSKYLREDGSWVTPPNDNTTYSAATTSTAGLMSAADKSKLDGIASGATNTAAVTESTVAGWGFTKNTGTLTAHQSVSSANNTASWGSAVVVGTVGGTDLKFTMPANPNTTPVTSVAGNTGAVTTAQIATALTSAGYKLTDTDTNTWRTVQCNSTSIGDNTLNLVAGTNVTLTRDGGKITISSTDTNTWPTKVSQLTNDSGYITSYTNTVTSINGKTGAIAAADMAAVLTAAGYKLTDTDTNTWRPLGTTADTACAGNDSRLSNARPASDVYSWAKASSKPSYSYSEISNTPSSLPASDVYAWAKASSKPSYSWSEISSRPTALSSFTNDSGYITSSGSCSYATSAGSAPASDVYSWAKASSKPSYTLDEVGASMSATTISANTSSSCSITGSGNAGKSQTIVYVNSGTSTDYTVTVPTTYKTPKNAAIEVKCPKGGYCEVNYINIGGTVYARAA